MEWQEWRNYMQETKKLLFDEIAQLTVFQVWVPKSHTNNEQEAV